MISIARKAIALAKEMAEEHGIPFNSGVCEIGNIYTPKSYFDKFPGLDSEFVDKITETFPSHSWGWYH